MASSEAAERPDALVAALREQLATTGAGQPDDADRLASLLLGRERFAEALGAQPGGQLATLPPPFDAGSLSIEAIPTPATDRPPAEAIGAGYEGGLDAAARGERGQFYTPAPVADALVRWAIPHPGSAEPTRVLDPAVGTGSFLLAAYRRLACRQSGEAGPSLTRLIGVDIDAAALHLAGLRLAVAAGEPAPTDLALHHASFFDCAPAETPADAGAVNLAPVDAVVGNPPFVRADALEPDVAHYRRHLTQFGPADGARWVEGPDALSRRSDAYVYFVTHATRFLRPGGRLALVLPTKWLMSEYGEPFRAFLRDQYRVHAIVGFGTRPFDDALVDTCLLLAERCRSGEGPLQFVRVDETTDPDALYESCTAETAAGDATQQAVTRPQAVLTADEPLAPYLEVPTALRSLFDSTAFVRLDELAEVARGTMTGANRFFFVDAETADRFGLEDRFLTPAVKSLRSVDRPAVTPADIERWLVDVRPYVAEVAPATESEASPAAVVTDRLRADGYDGLAAYVEHAEAAGWHEGRTCQSRTVWFDLGPLRAPAAFVPKLLRERLFVIENGAGAVPSNAIDGVWPAAEVDAGALLAVLNATVGTAAMEVTGRDEAGMLQLMTYETASLPTLDVRTVPAADRRALARAGSAFAADPCPATRTDLDAAVASVFDLPLSPAALRTHVSDLRRQRLLGSEPSSASAD